MCIVEGIVNGRPITRLSEDPRDALPLTHNHLLLHYHLGAPPSTVHTRDDGDKYNTWQMFSGPAGWRNTSHNYNIARNGYTPNGIFKWAILFSFVTRTPLVVNGRWVSSSPYTQVKTDVFVLCRSRLKPGSTIDQQTKSAFLKPAAKTDSSQIRTLKGHFIQPVYQLRFLFVYCWILVNLAHNSPWVCDDTYRKDVIGVRVADVVPTI